MELKKFKRTRRACFTAYLTMASIFTLPPMLFVTFREMYGISYTLLGSLVLTNFCTQLAIDLVFTFFTKYFNIRKTVRIMPVLTSMGLALYALAPVIFPDNVYVGLLLGTMLFSVSAGLSEVLLSPIIAAIPSDNPERDMSLLHSIYAWGVVFMVSISTLFFSLFGTTNWQYLTFFLAALPLITCFMFCISPIPDVNIEQDKGEAGAKRRNIGLALCAVCIFLGGASENVMTNWVSSFLESALSISKTFGDVFGMALFAVLLGFGRVLYAKFGKNISNILLLGMAGAVVCYLVAGLCNNPVIALFACILTGFATSMLWPGTLIYMEEKIPRPGVAAYALMAAGGDFGSSVAPQLMGVIVDTVSESSFASKLGQTMSISAEQIGMKTGMVITSLFPMVGVLVIVVMKRFFRAGKEQ